MYVKRNIRWNIVLRFAWLNLILYTLWALAVYFVHHYFDHQGRDISIPFLPVSTIGIAVAFYIGFKNNASYDRFWEARKIWGGIVNYSRTWGNQVMSFVTLRSAHPDVEADEIYHYQKKLIYRHIAWLNALRLQLRQPTSFSLKHPANVRAITSNSPEWEKWNNNVSCFLPTDEYNFMIERRNMATQLIRQQGEDLRFLQEKLGLIGDYRHIDMMKSLEEFYNLQGKCERIKNTPFPRQYAFFSKVFTNIFIFLLPMALIGEFASMGHGLTWLMVPFSVLISWVFSTMEIVGDNSEDPFEEFINDVPMTALCRTIEIDLREMLGETRLPEKVRPVNDILL